MGKRSSLVVLSSEDDEADRSLSSNRRSTRSSATRLVSTAPAKNPGRAKKARGLSSRSSLGSVSTDWDDVRLSFGDFDEEFRGSKVPAGFRRSNSKELWVEKYKPRSFEELAVHKKKVEEVKGWFEERLTNSKGESSNHALVITGQAGVGKSATIHVIASQLDATLCEWNTPTPVVWQEHIYNSSTGVQYMSKLEEFENFVERVRKYGLIPSSLSVGSKASIILLIDDLPVTNGKVAFQRLQNCVRLLVQTTRTPTAILITDRGKADSEDQTAGYLDELSLSLQSAGACKVSFNPITSNSIKKVLSRICKEEQCNVTAEQVDLIAKASGGDIRNAITSLQFFYLKPTPMHLLPSSITPPRSGKGKQAPLYAKGKPDMDNGYSLLFGRDDTLSLFHALGKFLHNKRETEDIMELDGAAFHVREDLSRLPLKMDAPEKILCQAHGQARPIADFLHENVLDFLSEEAMDDSWSVASYLSDADLLLATFRGTLSRQYEAENVLQSAGASVAVRGVLFGNNHPLPSRWHAVRRPKLWQVEKSSFYKKKEMVNQRFGAYSGMCSSDLTVIATEYMPAFKWLGFRAQGGLEDNVERMSLGDQDSEVEDDIEDCLYRAAFGGARYSSPTQFLNSEKKTPAIPPVSFSASSSSLGVWVLKLVDYNSSSILKGELGFFQGHVTRSRVQAQLQEQQAKARWNTHLTKILASLMVDQVHRGNTKNSYFGMKAWKYICDEFYKRTGLKWDKELKNRYADMRKMYVIIKSLLDRSDISWDEATGTITASDEVWAEYTKEHAEAEALRNSGCPIYKELCIIFSEPATNGKHDLPNEHEEGTPTFHQLEPLSFQQVVLSSSESEEADAAADHKETVQPITPSSAGIRKRGRKGIDDAIAGAILEMAAASKLRKAAIQQRDARYTITNCIKALDEMKGVDEQVYFAAIDLFNDPTAREIFLSLNRDKRLIWLQRKCRSSS